MTAKKKSAGKKPTSKKKPTTAAKPKPPANSPGDKLAAAQYHLETAVAYYEGHRGQAGFNPFGDLSKLEKLNKSLQAPEPSAELIKTALLYPLTPPVI